MRILFFDKTLTDYKGIEILSAILKQNGHHVDLLLDPGFGKLLYLKIPFLNQLVSDKLLLKKAKQFKPDLIGMSIMTNNFLFFRSFGRKLKKEMDVPIIVGGVHPTSVPEEVIKEDWVDIICIGDGEEAMVELVDNMQSGKDITKIRNLWVKDEKGNIYRNELRPLINDIDVHPFPDRSVYAQYGIISRAVYFMAGRGCAYNCSFCINNFRDKLYPGQKYFRKRSIDNIINELIEVKEKYKPKSLRFEDDVLISNVKWLNEFKEKYTKYINLPFHCYITPNGVTEEIIGSLKECGCKLISMGVQSGCAQIRYHLMNRHYSNEKVIEAANIINRAGIKLHTEYMFGLPGETPENMWETLELNEQLHAHDTIAGIFYPYPKTELTGYCIKNNLIDDVIYKKIIEGRGSPNSFSLLKHPYANDALKFKEILPLYNFVPKIFKPLLKLLLRKRYSILHRILYVLSIPVLLGGNDKDFIKRALRAPYILYKTRNVLKNFGKG